MSTVMDLEKVLAIINNCEVTEVEGLTPISAAIVMKQLIIAAIRVEWMRREEKP